MLIDGNSTRANRRKRLFLFAAWLGLVSWLLATHVFWRDEVRAFSLALSGQTVGEMLRDIHGEGHPALWYLILRLCHEILPVREVLPAAGALIGIGAMALFAFRAPFRLPILGLVLFSLFGAFEYVVVARNYGISALLMFALAALYPRIRNTPAFGLMLALLCNTNVPSCILAATFLLYRFVDLVTANERPLVRDWLVFLVNGGIALVGALLCFLTVYPPLNQGAVSSNFGTSTARQLFEAVGPGGQGFSNLLLNLDGWVPVLVLWSSCLLFARNRAGFAAAFAGLLALKVFFYFVYPSGYRHEALFVVFLLSLQWMMAQGAGADRPNSRWMAGAETIGTCAFALLLIAQTLDLAKPLYWQLRGVPYSRSANLVHLLKQPSLAGAIVMADPDVMLEPLPYYADNPLWFLREEQFGHLFLAARADRREMSLDAVLADMQRLHRLTGRPILFLSQVDLAGAGPKRVNSMYREWTILTPDRVNRFRSETRLIARLRPAITDEAYDVYVYPR